MRQWGLHQGLEEDKTIGSHGFTKVKLIPDGAAAFTRGMGMSCIWSSERGFGERSWRYSMVVNDGKIEKLFIEQPMIQNSGPDPFEVSDATT
jgi:thioredoxin-dependent peroxiredoxin